MLLTLVLFILGIGALWAGAELLIGGSVVLAHRLRLSSLLIGLTVVAFGTSAPELAAGIRAGLAGHPEVNIGNVVGSNIANIGLILGLAALVKPIAVRSEEVRGQVGITIAVTFIAIVLMMGDRIERWQGGVLVLALLAYLWYSFRGARTVAPDAPADAQAVEQTAAPRWLTQRSAPFAMLAAIFGIGVLVVGAHLLVDAAIDLATAVGVPSLVISLTVVALGTSLPELAASVLAARRGQPDIVVGNVLGSNIFNILAVFGVTALIKPVDVDPAAVQRDVWFMLGYAIACFPIMLTRGGITRLEGGVLLVVYLGYAAALYFL